MRLYFPDHKHIFYVIYQLTQDNLAMVRTLTQGEKKGKMECGTWCRAGLRLISSKQRNVWYLPFVI